jgi:hypothetical protein
MPPGFQGHFFLNLIFANLPTSPEKPVQNDLPIFKIEIF